MADLFPITAAEIIKEMERELRMRHQVYGHQVADGKLKQAVADRRIAIVEKIIADYRNEKPVVPPWAETQ